jgi:hypothetical protein
LFSRKPIAGVPYAEGAGSAFASITALGGFAPTDAQGNPRTLQYDMGLHKITVVPNVKGKDPGIYFTLDEEDASWSPEKVAERRAREESQEIQQETVGPASIIEQQEPQETIKPEKARRRREMEQIQETIPTRLVEPMPQVAIVNQPVAPQVAQPEAVMPKPKPQPRKVVREETEGGFDEASPFEETNSGFADTTPFEDEMAVEKETGKPWWDRDVFSDKTIFEKGNGAKQSAQPEEAEEANIIEMKDWGTSPAYRPVIPNRRRMKQPNSEERKSGIIASR